MANVLIEETTMRSIGDAIREKIGRSDKIFPADMANEIKSIETYTEIFQETISGSLTKIDLSNFHDMQELGRYAFAYQENLASATLPDELTNIKTGGFYGCKALTHIDLKNVKILGGYTFFSSGLANIEIPESVKNFAGYDFASCSNLESVTFKGTPDEIANNIFVSSSMLKTINVPWTEGAVEGAPWGAVNATINYDYVEGE